MAAVLSRRGRRVVVAAAVIDAVHDWMTHRDCGMRMSPIGYMVLKRLDDIAYGAGLWAGALRARTLRPLRPTVKW